MPRRLRNTHATFDWAVVRTRGPAVAPVRTLENHLPLGLSSRTFIDLFAEGERVHVELDGELVDSLLKRKASLRMARRPERRTGTCVHKDVVLLGEQVRALVQVGCGTSSSGSSAYACRAVACELDCGQRSIALCADLQLLVRVGPVTDDMLLPAVEHQLDGSVRLSRQVCRDDPLIAGTELRSEPTAHEFGDDANLALRQLEDVGELAANARRALGRGVDGHLFRFPIDDEAMRFEGGVRLHLGEILALYNHVRLGETLFRIAELLLLWPMDIARLRNALRSTAATGTARFVGRSGEYHRSIGSSRV
jgi:hypothetical protein